MTPELKYDKLKGVSSIADDAGGVGVELESVGGDDDGNKVLPGSFFHSTGLCRRTVVRRRKQTSTKELINYIFFSYKDHLLVIV